LASLLPAGKSVVLARRLPYVTSVLPQVYIVLAVVAVNVVVLRLIRALNRRGRPQPMCPRATEVPLPAPPDGLLTPGTYSLGSVTMPRRPPFRRCRTATPWSTCTFWRRTSLPRASAQSSH